MEADTQRQGNENNMEVIEGEFTQNKQSAIEMLINNCMTVDVSIPRVVRGKFE